MLLAGLNFYRLLQPLRLTPDRLLYALVFFMPPLLFWTGGIYKEGMVYLGLSCCLWAVSCLSNKISIKHILLLIIGLGLITLFRNYLLLLLLPALALLFYTLKYPQYVAWKFAGAYLVGILAIVIFAPYLPVNIYEILAQRQWAFLAEHGGSDFGATPLQPTLAGIVQILPQGFLNAALRPFLWSASGAFQVLSAIGILCVWIFAGVVIFFGKKRLRLHPIALFLLFYALSNLALIGLLVSNSGTMMRYRVIAIHFIVLFFAFCLNVKSESEYAP